MNISIVPPSVLSMDKAGVVSAEYWSYQYFIRDQDQLGDTELYSEEYHARSLNKVVCTGSKISNNFFFLGLPFNTFELSLVYIVTIAKFNILSFSRNLKVLREDGNIVR